MIIDINSDGPLLHEFEFFEAFKSPHLNEGRDEPDDGENSHEEQQEGHSSNDIILLMVDLYYCIAETLLFHVNRLNMTEGTYWTIFWSRGW